MRSSLEHKTVRPGNLGNYAYYYSSRSVPKAPQAPAEAKPRRAYSKPMLVIIAILLFSFIGVKALGGHNTAADVSQTPAASNSQPAATAALPKPTQVCTSSGQYIKVSVSQRHLWACQDNKLAYDSKVITGMEQYPATETPVGTYKIYAKQANTVLTGSDETGSWRDPVSYWMPFLDNQYGTYGFHDANWRSDNEFGNVDPNGPNASHGCVELPIATSKWLYGWAPVGTPVTVMN